MTKIIEAHEKRIAHLENILTDKKAEPKKVANSYSGLTGGIQKLIDEKYVDMPRRVSEINEELKRNGYHYPAGSVDKILRVDFLKRRNTLTRIKEGGIYKYVIRR